MRSNGSQRVQSRLPPDNVPKAEHPGTIKKSQQEPNLPAFKLSQLNHNVPEIHDLVCDQDRLNKLPVTAEKMCYGDECETFTCNNFFLGKPGDHLYKTAKHWMEEKQSQIQFSNLEQFVTETADCSVFIRQHGYHLKSVSAEEAQFPIAFNILMHKDLTQVERLLRAIYRPQNIYCFHVDAKVSQSLMDAVKSLVDCFPNVFIASKLERIVYAGFSRLQADINCMKDLIKSGHKWKYLFNLAGQSFPLKSNAEIVEILKIYNGSNDIEGIYGNRILKSRFQNEWIEDKGQLKKTGKKNPPPPGNIDIVRGSAYGVFSRAFVEFLLTDQRAVDLLEWSRKTYSPDEHYWATLHHTYSNPHLNTPGAFTGTVDQQIFARD